MDFVNSDGDRFVINPIYIAAFLTVLLFTALKLTGHIDWHWAYVLMPLWGTAALWAFFALLAKFSGWMLWKFSTEEERADMEARETLHQVNKRLRKRSRMG